MCRLEHACDVRGPTLQRALERAGVPYFRSYDLHHTCATLLLYEGRTLSEAAEHLGHADPGFTARTYAHVMRAASCRRRIRISEAIRRRGGKILN